MKESTIGNIGCLVFLSFILISIVIGCPKYEKQFRDEFNRPSTFSNPAFINAIETVKQNKKLKVVYITGQSIDWRPFILGHQIYPNFHVWNLVFKNESLNKYEIFQWDGIKLVK